MRRRKRFTIKVLAGAFAAAALAVPASQAMPPPEDLPGDQVRALREAKAKKVGPATAKTVRRVSLPRRPIREYQPEG